MPSNGCLNSLLILLRRLYFLMEYIRRLLAWDDERMFETPGEDLRTFRSLPIAVSDKRKAALFRVQPQARSGHRIFVDRDFLYVIGGYDRTRDFLGGMIFEDVHQYNLFTHEWTQMKLEGDFPGALASFALAQTSPYSNHVVLFGGTAVPFGTTTSSDVHILSMNVDEKNGNRPVARAVKLEEQITGHKRGCYGHAMVRGAEPGTFYVIGGTTGRDFFLDVDEMRIGNDGVGRWRNLAVEESPDLGLYRLEVIQDGDELVMFGGGTPQEVKDFEELITFNLKTRKYGRIQAKPDKSQVTVNVIVDELDMEEEDVHTGYPQPRRCHSVTQWGRRVIVVGGCSEDRFDASDRRYSEIYGDCWSFDLDTHTWTRLPYTLPLPVFFHDAAVTQDGCLIVWGGVCDEFSDTRIAEGQMVWLVPPSLKSLAAMAVKAACGEKLLWGQGKYLRLSDPASLVRRVLNGCPDDFEPEYPDMPMEAELDESLLRAYDPVDAS